jgi:hypothetical protein
MINELEKNRLSLHTALKEYFADTSIPLQDRWDLFEKTPSYLKAEHMTYYCSAIDEVLGEDAVMYEGEVLNVERYQTVYAMDIVLALEDRAMYGDNKYYGKLNDLKEAILKENLYSYTYDW